MSSVSLAPALPLDRVLPIVQRALEEDAPWGDLTTTTLVPADAGATGRFVAREPGVVCGLPVAALVFAQLDGAVQFRATVAEGTHVVAGDTLAVIEGLARALLTGERLALNLLQRMSGIATTTACYVAAVRGTGATIVDTRKTAPGLRLLDKYAVRCGGGGNHRFSLSDGMLVKDNHLAVAGGDDTALTARLRGARAVLPHTARMEVEVDRLDQIDDVLAAGVDTIMLDNFSLDDLRSGVQRIAGRALVEASGGVTLDRVRAIAATGVDLISVGALTHSAPALDMGLDIALRTA